MRFIGFSICTLLSIYLLIFYACTLEKEPEIPAGTTNENAPVFISTNLERVAEHTISARAVLSSFGNLNILRYGWVWSENPGPTLETVSENSKIELEALGEDSFRTEIPGLLTGKLYHIRPYVVTGSGERYGEEKEIKLVPTFVTRSYNGYIYYVKQMTDEGFILVGTTLTDNNTFKRDIYIIKINSAGYSQWEKKVGLNIQGAISSVRQTTDGGFIFLGYTSTDLYLVKTNESGTVEWERLLSRDGTEQGFSIQQTVDGGFIVIGTNWEDVAGATTKMYLVKTNSFGDTLWTNTFSGLGRAQGKSIQETTDAGFILAGTTSSSTTKTYLIKTNADGILQWDKTFEGGSLGLGVTVQQTTDGGFMILKSASGGPVDFSQIQLIKTDAGGSLAWEKLIGGNNLEAGISLQQTTDSGFILLGNVRPPTGPMSEDNNMYLVKTNFEGEKQWERIFGGLGDQQGVYVQQTTDGGFILLGREASTNPQMYIVKTDENGKTY